MKFSYPLLKKFVPVLKDKQQAMDALTLHSFEAEDAGGAAIEVKLPPNRYADCSGHVGIARELSASLGVLLKLPSARPVQSARAPRSFSVKVEDADRCPRYTACALDGVRIGPSPAWLATVLAECGLRPISNVVDVMNYVMLETGQPLHAFDLDRLEKHALVVRPARAGERITTIDGQDVELPVGTLVIADAKRPQAIAGVKGGKHAEVTAATTRIVVEAATFEPSAIYRTSRAVNISTDASQRFARGMPTSLPSQALARAVELLAEVAHAMRGDAFDSRPQAPAPHVVRFDAKRYERLIGAPVSGKRVRDILVSLGFTPMKDDRWQVPRERVDIGSFADLVEEVARFAGYGKLPSAAPHVALKPPADDTSVAAKMLVRQILAGLGFDEVYTHSFVSEQAAAAFDPAFAVVRLENPPSDLFSALRPSLATNVFNAIDANARFFDNVNIFEVGKAFQRSGQGVTERLMLCMMSAAKKQETFFYVKGALERLLEGFGIRNIAFATKPASLGTEFLSRAGANAADGIHTLAIEAEGKTIGYIGAARHAVRDWCISVAEFDLEQLSSLASANVAFTPLSSFPSMVRDLSLRLSTAVKIGEVMRAAQVAVPDLLEDVDLVDEYADPSWKGEQSITLRFVFHAPDRTLTAVEVDRLMDRIAAALKRDFQAAIR